MRITPEFKKLQETRFARCSIRPERQDAVTAAVNRVQRNWSRYEVVSEDSGVPAWVIACLHCLESSFSFGKHLHNGDPLTARTKLVPAGRPKKGTPPFTWEESALDALEYDGASAQSDWSLGAALCWLEGYNGWGYQTGSGRASTPPNTSAYLWSFTSEYVKGKYAHDGEWDGELVSAQVGVAALLKGMVARGLVKAEELGGKPSDPKPPSGKGRPFVPANVPLNLGGTLRYGSEGEGVYVLQCALIGLALLAKPKDGELLGEHFNSEVLGAVMKFQRNVMKDVGDGIVGPLTKIALEDALTKARTPKFPPVPNEPVKDASVARLRRLGDLAHLGAWSGLKCLELRVGDQLFDVASGARGCQAFRRPQDPRSYPGNLEPLPQGRYRIGNISWAGGKDNYEVSHGAGLGPVWVPLDAEFSDDRGAFGFHLDGNIGASPGSAGCVVFRDVGDLKRFVAALRKYDPKVLSVEWGLA